MSQLQFLELPKGVYLPLTIINPGLWYWKEDSRTLEFSCAQLKEEPKDTKEKNKKGKTIQFQELGAKPLERGGPHYFRNLFNLTVSSGEDKSPRPTRRAQSELITLEDVKYAALFLAHEDDSIHVSSFSLVMRCKQLDDFLMALLYYISFYLEKITLEMKPKSFMGVCALRGFAGLMFTRLCKEHSPSTEGLAFGDQVAQNTMSLSHFTNLYIFFSVKDSKFCSKNVDLNLTLSKNLIYLWEQRLSKCKLINSTLRNSA